MAEPLVVQYAETLRREMQRIIDCAESPEEWAALREAILDAKVNPYVPGRS